MSIKIIKAGIMATIQDAGRTGFRSIGVGSSGAMDLFAMQAANYLCGSDGIEPVIECSFPGPEIYFEQDAVISITGADFSATLNDTVIPSWRTILVKKESVLKFRQPVLGARAYLAVTGGWHAEKWMGSSSTLLKLEVGGYSGRALKKGDSISFPPVQGILRENKILPWFISAVELGKIYQPSNRIRCVAGPEFGLLTENARRNFGEQDFVISQQSDRMGYRLRNKPLLTERPFELLSSPVDMGTVQLLPGGTLIILMADHPTTGGYPRVASVIKADLSKLAQAAPGQGLHFSVIPIQEAENSFMTMQRNLQEIKQACHLNLKNILSP